MEPQDAVALGSDGGGEVAVAPVTLQSRFKSSARMHYNAQRRNVAHCLHFKVHFYFPLREDK